MSLFATPEQSHEHSLKTLEALYEYDDFMESIGTVIDLGCGAGQDLDWWATRTTRDDTPRPLNIQCTGIDIAENISMVKHHPNIIYQNADFEDLNKISKREQFDILWSHDSFQYAINPIATLSNWWRMANPGAMLVLIVPQTTNIYRHRLSITQESGCYYHHSLVSLIHMLAIAGWDCRSGFFLKEEKNSWLHAIVYKSDQAPKDPKTTSWYDLLETKLLPESAEHCINAHGYLAEQDLILPWLDHSLTWFGRK